MSKVGNESVALSTVGKGVLVGRFDYNLDPKKRFTIPSEWRAAMGNPAYVYVMPDPDSRCLDLIPAAEMEVKLEELRKQALFDPTYAAAFDVLAGNSQQATLDVQGRIRVCDKLLQFANLTTTVAMVGSFRKAKLWDPQALKPADKVDQAEIAKAVKLLRF